VRAGARAVTRRPLLSLRRRYYAEGWARGVLERIPSAVRARLGLDDESARWTRRIEIGAGPHPQRGYLHVDVDTNARHLEVRAPAWRLPFPNDWASEILSIHSLEHVHPRMLQRTLREWHRVLAPGGAVRIHVPNSPALMRAYLAAGDSRERWTLSGALLGMYCGPDVSGPEELTANSDHQILFDGPLLLAALEEAGFQGLVELTDEVSDRHTDAWSHVVERYSIVVQGRKATARQMADGVLLVRT
jgi:SAM-dependent methyltransferase